MPNLKKRKLSAVTETKRIQPSKVQVTADVVSQHTQHQDAPENTEGFLGIRALLADLKSGALSHVSIKQRLEVLSQKSFPRREEWTLSYLANILAKEQQNSSELNATWSGLILVMDKISIERLQVLLRRVDLVALLLSYLQADNSSYDALPSIIGMLERFLDHRKTRGLLATTFERASGALLSCLDVLSRSSCDLSSCGPLIDVLLYHVKHNSNHKKLNDFLRIQCFQALVKLIEHKCSMPGPGMEHLCSMSFACVNLQFKGHDKRLATRNLLLEMWLAVVETNQITPVLTTYQRTQTGPSLTRPLSADITIRDSLKGIVNTALSLSNNDASVATTLLQLDLDLILPSQEDALWSYLDNCQEDQLLVQCLKAYVDIRSLPAFFKYLLMMRHATVSLITNSLSNTLANVISRLTVAVQDEIMQTVLESASVLKEPLLIALIGGLPLRSSILQKHRNVLSNPHSDVHLRRLVALKSDSNTLELMQTATSENPSQSAAEFETWLRLQEVQNIDGQQDNKEKKLEQIDVLLLIASDNIDFLMAILRRWLPTLVPLMDSSQKSELIRLILSRINDTAFTELICHQSALLELPELHEALQDEIMRSFTSNLALLHTIPAEFFHKAVKRQIVTLLASSQILDDSKCQILLKYSDIGIFPAFTEVGDYLKFAKASLGDYSTSPTGRIASREQLRRVYIKTLSQSHCLSIVEDVSCDSLLRLEVFEECSSSESLLRAGKELALFAKNNIIRDKSAITNGHSRAVVLLRLLKAFCKLGMETSFLLERQDCSSAEEWLSIAKITPGAPFSHTCYELAAWQVASVEDSLSVTNAALADETLSAESLYSLFSGFVSCLTVEKVQSLLDEKSLALNPVQLSRLLLEVLQSKPRDGALNSTWIRHHFRTTSKSLIHAQTGDEKLVSFDVLQIILETHARSLDTTATDDLFACVQECLATTSSSIILSTQTTRMHRLLRATFQHHAYRLKDRYHIIILQFQRLLTVCLSNSTEAAKDETESLVRLFETFLTSSRALSTNPEQFNRAFAKHVPWLLIEYIDAITNSNFSDRISVQTKKTIEENLIYECMGLCGQHEREMVATSLDSAGRGMFKRLYEDWSKFGRWNER